MISHESTKRRQRWQLLPFHILQKRPTRRRDVVDLVCHVVLLDRGDGVAAAGEGEARAAGDGVGDRLGAGVERFEPPHADRAVPDDGAGALDDLGQAASGFGADVQDHFVGVDL